MEGALAGASAEKRTRSTLAKPPNCLTRRDHLTLQPPAGAIRGRIAAPTPRKFRLSAERLVASLAVEIVFQQLRPASIRWWHR